LMQIRSTAFASLIHLRGLIEPICVPPVVLYSGVDVLAVPACPNLMTNVPALSK
jgi:hypothetical protein